MDKQRLWRTLGLCLIRGGNGRADYIRKHHVFRSMGENCDYMPRIVPLYPGLIKIGNRVNIASHVQFHTHDTIHSAIGVDDKGSLLKRFKGRKMPEGMGCIEIGDHVFVGAGSCIEYNVKIGDHVIICAGSVVTGDIPPNTVVRGNPARVMCTMEQYLTMRSLKPTPPEYMEHATGGVLSRQLEDWMWDAFHKSRRKG